MQFIIQTFIHGERERDIGYTTFVDNALTYHIISENIENQDEIVYRERERERERAQKKISKGLICDSSARFHARNAPVDHARRNGQARRADRRNRRRKLILA